MLSHWRSENKVVKHLFATIPHRTLIIRYATPRHGSPSRVSHERTVTVAKKHRAACGAPKYRANTRMVAGGPVRVCRQKSLGEQCSPSLFSRTNVRPLVIEESSSPVVRMPGGSPRPRTSPVVQTKGVRIQTVSLNPGETVQRSSTPETE